jgi:hypothetical protein
MSSSDEDIVDSLKLWCRFGCGWLVLSILIWTFALLLGKKWWCYVAVSNELSTTVSFEMTLAGCCKAGQERSDGIGTSIASAEGEVRKNYAPCCGGYYVIRSKAIKHVI